MANISKIKLPSIETPYDIVDTGGRELIAGKIDNPTTKTAGDGLVYDGTSWAVQDGYGYNGSSGDVEVFNETLSDWDLIESKNIYYCEPSSSIKLKANKIYTVSWNGTQYSCTAAITTISDNYFIYIGNFHIVDSSAASTNEPFLYRYCLTESWYDWTSNTDPGSIEVIVTIYMTAVHQFDSKYIPGAPTITIGLSQITSQDPITIQFTDEQAEIIENTDNNIIKIDASNLGMGIFFFNNVDNYSGHELICIACDHVAYENIGVYNPTVIYNTATRQGVYSVFVLKPATKTSAMTQAVGIDRDTGRLYTTPATSPNDGTLTLQVEGTTKATFTANQSTDSTFNITASDIPEIANKVDGKIGTTTSTKLMWAGSTGYKPLLS